MQRTADGSDVGSTGVGPADVAATVALLTRQLTALAAADDVDEHTAVTAAGAALGATDRLTAAAVALLGRTTHRGVIASEGVSTSTWLRVFARRTTADERMLTATVERLEDLPTVHRWFARGLVSWPAVRGIVAAVRNLTREQRGWLDATFAEHGDTLCSMEADRIVSAAERLADQARPDLHEAREQQAFTARSLAIHPRLDGSSHVTAELDAEGTATLLAGLAAAEDLGDEADQDGGRVRDEERDPRWRRRQRSNADRLIGIVGEHLAGRSGGRARPSMIVVTDVSAFDASRSADGGAQPSNWSSTAQLLWNCHAGPVELTASAARRLSCDATLRHVLVDGDTVLGATAAHPAVSATLRAALLVRDGSCRFPGCRVPVDQCDNHHLIPRAHGGRTALQNLVLLCSAHHHAVHDSGWATTLHADGALDLTRRGVTITSHPRTADRPPATRPPPRGRPRRRERADADPPTAAGADPPPERPPAASERTALPF